MNGEMRGAKREALPMRQRWGEVPDAEATAKWPVRRGLTRWRAGDGQALERGFQAQPVAAWLAEREEAYAAVHPAAGSSACDREAMLDLLCWQRQERDPAAALRWMREFDAAATEALRTWPA